MFWHASVLPSVCPQGGYPYPIMLCNISQNAMGQTLGGVPCHIQPGGTLMGGYPARGYPARSSGGVPCWGGGGGGTLVRYLPPRPGQDGGYPAGGGYPGRTTEGVLNTRRAVCLLRSRRRTFLFNAIYSQIEYTIEITAIKITGL